jgi:hypothetical protein
LARRDGKKLWVFEPLRLSSVAVHAISVFLKMVVITFLVG